MLVQRCRNERHQIMQAAHALNMFDSFHTMLDMESLKRSGTATPTVSPRPSSARRHTPQQFAIDSRQIQRCQQQSQQ